MARLKTIYTNDLICDEDGQGFHEKLGFSKPWHAD